MCCVSLLQSFLLYLKSTLVVQWQLWSLVGSLELPSALHHGCEVVVPINGAAHSLVVLTELFESDDAIGLLRVPLAHELLEDLLRCLFALDDLWVLRRVVDLRDVGQGNLAILCHVKLVVCKSDPSLSLLVEVSL